MQRLCVRPHVLLFFSQIMENHVYNVPFSHSPKTRKNWLLRGMVLFSNVIYFLLLSVSSVLINLATFLFIPFMPMHFLSRNEMFTSVIKNLRSIHNTNHIFSKNSFPPNVSSCFFLKLPSSCDLLFVWYSLKQLHQVCVYSYMKNDAELFRKSYTNYI